MSKYRRLTGSSVHQRSTTRHSSRTTATGERFTRFGDPSTCASTRTPSGAFKRRAGEASTPPLVGVASDALVVSRNQQCSLLGQARPRSDLDDGADGSGTGARAHLPQAFAQVGAQLVALGPDELELVADRLGEHERLEAQHHRGRGQLGKLEADCRAQASWIGGGGAEGGRPPPPAAADEAPPRRG